MLLSGTSLTSEDRGIRDLQLQRVARESLIFVQAPQGFPHVGGGTHAPSPRALKRRATIPAPSEGDETFKLFEPGWGRLQRDRPRITGDSDLKGSHPCGSLFGRLGCLNPAQGRHRGCLSVQQHIEGDRRQFSFGPDRPRRAKSACDCQVCDDAVHESPRILPGALGLPEGVSRPKQCRLFVQTGVPRSTFQLREQD